MNSLLTEGDKKNIRKFIKNNSTVELYEYIESVIDERIKDAVWHADSTAMKPLHNNDVTLHIHKYTIREATE